MKIEIQIKALKDMPYQGEFDFYDYREDGTLFFEVADLGNPHLTKVMLIHAIVEELLATYQEITSKVITDFDIAYKGDGEPGEELDCPYREAHLMAKGIEMILLAKMGIPLKTYEGLMR